VRDLLLDDLDEMTVPAHLDKYGFDAQGGLTLKVFLICGNSLPMTMVQVESRL